MVQLGGDLNKWSFTVMPFKHKAARRHRIGKVTNWGSVAFLGATTIGFDMPARVPVSRQ